MENKSQINMEDYFEGNDFIQECLESFDKNVSEIEAEYDCANKSA